MGFALRFDPGDGDPRDAKAQRRDSRRRVREQSRQGRSDDWCIRPQQLQRGLVDILNPRARRRGGVIVADHVVVDDRAQRREFAADLLIAQRLR